MADLLDSFDRGVVASYRGGFRLGFLAAARFLMDGGTLPRGEQALEEFLDRQWEAEGMDLTDMGVRPTESKEPKDGE